KPFLDAYLPGKEPLGQLVYLNNRESPPSLEAHAVVGVVGPIRDYIGQVTAEPQIFEPYRQSSAAEITLLIKTSDDAASVAPDVRAAVRDVDPDEPLANLATLARVLEEFEAGDILFDTILSVFALLALLLALIGAYGVISLNAGQRTVEFGIRM